MSQAAATCPHCAELQNEIAYYKAELGLQVASAHLDRVRRALKVSPAETHILLALHAAKGRIVSLPQLLATMPPRYGDGEDRNWDNVKTHISRARKTLGPGVIKNVWGAGYRLTDAGLAIVDAAVNPTPSFDEEAA